MVESSDQERHNQIKKGAIKIENQLIHYKQQKTRHATLSSQISGQHNQAVSPRPQSP